MMRWNRLLGVLLLVLAGCGGDETTGGATPAGPAEGEELAIGAIDDLKADGAWGFATECKDIPVVEPLVDPMIVVSLDGLSLHLVDRAGDYDQVFAIGPGAIEDGTSLTPLSLGTPEGLFHLRMDKPIGAQTTDPDYNPWTLAYSCRIWWTNNETGQKIPVFAGLPFMRLEGAPSLAYAIHGPVDSYTLPSGGRLTRGFVSHGCIRMEAADVKEVFGRCLGHKVPVRVQRSIERLADGTAVDIPGPWFLSECVEDADCAYDGGICHANPYSGRGFCTRSCMQFCPDRSGQPESFCVADPDDDEAGICTLKGSKLNNHCLRYPGIAFAPGTHRFHQEGITADVCLPGSDGWIGGPCFSDLDCAPFEGTCEGADVPAERPGFCTEACTKYCPDATGLPGTFCVDDGAAGGLCAQKCILEDDCPFGYACTDDVPRFGEPTVSAGVCL